MSQPDQTRPVPGPAVPRPGAVPGPPLARPGAVPGPVAARPGPVPGAVGPRPGAVPGPPASVPTPSGPSPFAGLTDRPVSEHVAVFEAEHDRLQRELATIDQL